MQDEDAEILSRIPCQDLIQEHWSSYELVSSECHRVATAEGIVGDFYKLTLTVAQGKDTEQLRFFVKSVSQDPGKKEFLHHSGALLKEERMFSEIIPRILDNGIQIISSAVPRCFRIQPSSLMVFEDLNAEGYTTLNSREPLTLDCVKLTLESLAKLHASILFLEEVLKHGLAQDYKQELKEIFYIRDEGGFYFSVIQAALKGFATQIDLLCPNARDDLMKKIEQVLDDFPSFTRPSVRFRNTLCHGDLWIKNLMYKRENGVPKHCKIVDFQSYRYCPPAQDVMAFIYLTTDRDFRVKYLQESLEYYHREFTSAFEDRGARAEDVLAREDYVETCEYYKKFAVLQAAMHSHITFLTPEGLESFGDTPGYKERFFREDRSEHVVKWCNADSVYRRKMTECLEDLQEILD